MVLYCPKFVFVLTLSIVEVRAIVCGRRCVQSRLRSVSCSNGQQLQHLIAHYKVIGGEKSVIDASIAVQEALLSHIQNLKNLLHATPGGKLIPFWKMIGVYRFYFR